MSTKNFDGTCHVRQAIMAVFHCHQIRGERGSALAKKYFQSWMAGKQTAIQEALDEARGLWAEQWPNNPFPAPEFEVRRTKRDIVLRWRSFSTEGRWIRVQMTPEKETAPCIGSTGTGKWSTFLFEEEEGFMVQTDWTQFKKAV